MLIVDIISTLSTFQLTRKVRNKCLDLVESLPIPRLPSMREMKIKVYNILWLIGYNTIMLEVVTREKKPC